MEVFPMSFTVFSWFKRLQVMKKITKYLSFVKYLIHTGVYKNRLYHVDILYRLFIYWITRKICYDVIYIIIGILNDLYRDIGHLNSVKNINLAPHLVGVEDLQEGLVDVRLALEAVLDLVDIVDGVVELHRLVVLQRGPAGGRAAHRGVGLDGGRAGGGVRWDGRGGWVGLAGGGQRRGLDWLWGINERKAPAHSVGCTQNTELTCLT